MRETRRNGVVLPTWTVTPASRNRLYPVTLSHGIELLENKKIKKNKKEKKKWVGRVVPSLARTRFLPFVFSYKYQLSSSCSLFLVSLLSSPPFSSPIIFRRYRRQTTVVSAGRSPSSSPSPSSFRFSLLSPLSSLHLSASFTYLTFSQICLFFCVPMNCRSFLLHRFRISLCYAYFSAVFFLVWWRDNGDSSVSFPHGS